MADKKIEQYEREYNLVLSDVKDPSQKVSESEFKEMVSTLKFVGVDFEQREQFLKDNGYDVTRENLIDPTLSVKQKED